MPSPQEPTADGTNPLSKIKHVVVVMLENRSFDNLLGWLYDGETPPRGQQFEGLTRGMWNPLDNIDADGIPFVEKVYVRKNGEPLPYGRGAHKPVAPNFRLPTPDPGEGYRTTNHQLFGSYEVATLYPPEPTNMGFVNDYRDANLFNTYTYGEPPSDPREIMICYTPAQVPVLSTLAKQFAVCDHWYGSIPSQTLPNRHFAHAATSLGLVNNTPKAECEAGTIFNVMQDAIDAGRSDLSWRVYCGTGKQGLFSLTRLVMTQLHDPRFDANFHLIADFYRDAEKGTLPSYAFLEPQFHAPGANDQHPPLDIRPGDQFIADIYRALLKSPQWQETLLVITYDEHGGCYDHVAPPRATPPDKKRPPGQYGFLFNRFGVRVPAVIVSPWIEAGTICRPAGPVPFDHTSVIATVRRCFGLNEPLTERDRVAPDLGCCLTLTTPRTDQPAVTPLPLQTQDHSLHVPIHDLHELIHDIVAHRSGLARPEDQELCEFVREAYHEIFGSAESQAPKSEAPMAKTRIPLGSQERVTALYSYPNTPGSPLSLADTVTHWFGLTLERDGLAARGAKAKVAVEGGNCFLDLDGPEAIAADLAEYGVRLPKFLSNGEEALSTVVPDLKAKGLWDPSPDAEPPPYRPWRFFLPFGMAMLKQRSLQFFHYPPIRLLEGTQDYLQDPVPARCIELLEANGVPASDVYLFNTVVDATPIAAEDDQGSKKGGDPRFGLIPIQHFHAYQKAQVDLLLNPSSKPGFTAPIVVYGAHPRDTFNALYQTGLDLAKAPTAVAEILPGKKTPVLCANHPYVFYAMAQGFNTVGSGKFESSSACQKSVGVMRGDLVVTRWQALMADNPSLDPKAVYDDCVNYWNDAARNAQVCALVRHQASLFYASPTSLAFTFPITLDQAAALCAANNNDVR